MAGLSSPNLPFGAACKWTLSQPRHRGLSPTSEESTTSRDGLLLRPAGQAGRRHTTGSSKPLQSNQKTSILVLRCHSVFPRGAKVFPRNAKAAVRQNVFLPRFSPGMPTRRSVRLSLKKCHRVREPQCYRLSYIVHRSSHPFLPDQFSQLSSINVHDCGDGPFKCLARARLKCIRFNCCGMCKRVVWGSGSQVPCEFLAATRCT